MSHCIADLHLELAPSTLHRGKGDSLCWFARCESCGETTANHPLMSLALAENHWHAEIHCLGAVA